jgi:hypothetical protein
VPKGSHTWETVNALVNFSQGTHAKDITRYTFQDAGVQLKFTRRMQRCLQCKVKGCSDVTTHVLVPSKLGTCLAVQ